MIRQKIKIACTVALLALGGLAGCGSIDWMQAGRNAAASLCEGIGNCRNVCPDGSETGTRVPRCDYRAAN